MGWICYTSCPPDQVPDGAVWHPAEDGWRGGRLRVEYSWGGPAEHPEWRWPGFAGMPWQRTTDTTLPEGDPRRVVYFAGQAGG